MGIQFGGWASNRQIMYKGDGGATCVQYIKQNIKHSAWCAMGRARPKAVLALIVYYCSSYGART